jgi:signal peptidase I
MNNLDLLAQAHQDGLSEFIDKAARTPQSQIVIGVALLTLVRVGIYLWARNIPIHRRTGIFTVAGFVNEMCDAVIYAAIFVFLVIRPYLVQAFKIPSGSMVSTLLVSDYIVANKWVYRFSDPKVGEIVIFVPPVEAAVKPEQIDPDGQVNVDLIKRCIGTPGDLIEIKQNVLYRNGKKVDENYVHDTQRVDPVNETYREDTSDELAAEPKYDFKLVNYQGQIWPVNVSPSGSVNTDPSSAPRYRPTSPEMAAALTKLPPVPVPKGYYLMMGDNRSFSFDGRFWGLVPRADIVGKAEFIWLPLSRFGPIHSGPAK